MTVKYLKITVKQKTTITELPTLTKKKCLVESRRITLGTAIIADLPNLLPRKHEHFPKLASPPKTKLRFDWFQQTNTATPATSIAHTTQLSVILFDYILAALNP